MAVSRTRQQSWVNQYKPFYPTIEWTASKHESYVRDYWKPDFVNMDILHSNIEWSSSVGKKSEDNKPDCCGF